MLILVQNDPEVPSGSLLDLFEENEISYKIVCPFKGEALPSLAGIRALIVLGGAMGVHDDEQYPYLREVKAYVLHATQSRVALLGICLGGQLLADALGATVHSQRNGELGIHSVSLVEDARIDPLFADIPHQFTTFQWHNDCFDIPEGAIGLASSPVCAHQAFRYGINHYGLQFHPEVTRDIVSSWAEYLNCDQDRDRIVKEFECSEDAYKTVSKMLIENFLRLSKVID